MLSIKWERFFLIFVLLVHAGLSAITSHLHYFNTSAYILLYGVCFFIILTDLKRWLSTYTTHIFLFLVIIWAVLSVIWTTNVYMTIWGIVSLLGMLMISFYLYDKFNLEKLLDLLVLIGGILIIFNSLILIFIPEQGYHHQGPHIGLWKGMFAHKNPFGMLSYLLIIVFSLAIFFKRPFNMQALYLGLFLSILFLYNSKSTTSIMAIVVFAGLFLIKWLNVKKNIQWRWIFISLFLIVCMLFFYADQLLALFEKNLTFTGRTNIWSASWAIVQNDIFLGKGYFGWWFDSAHRPVGAKGAFHSHNGYLEVIVYFGLIGMLLFLLMLGRAVFLAARQFFSNQMTLQSIFPFLFLMSYCLQNTMESLFFLQRSILWILFIYFIIYLNNNSRQNAS